MKYLKFLPIAALLLFGIFSARAQTKTPGGVTTQNGTTFVAWLTPDSYSGNTWTNLIQNNLVGDFIAVQNLPSKTNSGGYNFHPTVDFPFGAQAEARYRLGSINNYSAASGQNLTTILVMKRSASNNYYDYVLSFGNADATGRLGWPDIAAANIENMSLFWPTAGRAIGAFREGILTIDNPNSNSGTVNVYKSSISTSTTAALPATGGAAAINNQRITIASGTSGSYYGYEGTIQEVIILSGNGGAGNHVNAADLQKIHSYLAVKYGISLNDGSNSTDYNYVNSAGTAVWNRQTNVGYNFNIFGIGRDDASNLNQTQSRSQSFEGLTIYKSATLGTVNNNADTQLLPVDQTFLMLGGNNGSEKNASYNYPVNTAYMNGNIGDNKISYRTNLIYRAQLTGTPGTVNMKLASPLSESVRFVLVSAFPTFAPGETRIYPVSANIAENVVINNGEFISFAGWSSAPGGVSSYSVDLWVDGNNSTNAAWPNIVPSASNISLVKFSTNAPQTRNSKYNYHKELYFGNTTSSKLRTSATYPLTSGTAYYVFVVSDATSIANDATLLTFNNAVGNNSLRWNTSNTNIFASYWPTTTARNTNASTTVFPKKYGITTLTVNNTQNNTSNNAMYINGMPYPFTFGNIAAATSNVNMLVGDANNTTGITGTNHFNGSIQEIILMKSAAGNFMTADEIAKIHSYLAIKYGIPLKSARYVNSSNAAVWDSTRNAGYGNNVFGLGRDDASGLYQRQAHSAEDPAFVAYISDLKPLNSDNAGTLKDMQYLMFGSNYTSQITTVSAFPASGYSGGGTLPADLNIQSRIYAAQLTGPETTMQVNLRSPSSDFLYALVSNSPAFTPANTTVYELGSQQTAEVTLDATNRYITFVGRATGPGGVVNGLRLWLRADNEGSIGIENTTPTSGTKLANYAGYNGAFDAAQSYPAVVSWTDMTRQQTYSYDAGPTTGTQGNQHRAPVMQASSPEMNYHQAVQFWSDPNSSPTYGAYLSNQATNILGGLSHPAGGNHTAYFVVNNDFNAFDWIYAMGFGRNDLLATVPGGTQYNRPAWGVQKGTFANINNGNMVGRFRAAGAAGTTADDTQGSTTSLYGTANMFTIGATTMLGYNTNTYNTTTAANSVYFRFNAVTDQSRTQFSWAGQNINFASPSTLGGAIAYTRILNGVMSEAILFDRTLGADEQTRLESYLAFKYGITLRPNNGIGRADYKFANGNPVWLGATGSGPYITYYNNVFAVIRDDGAMLNNPQSHSTDANSLLHLGVAGSMLSSSGINADIGEIEPGKAVAAGFDGVIGNMNIYVPGSEESCGGFTDRFTGTWFIHKTFNEPISMLVGAQNNTNYNYGRNEAMGREYYSKLGAGHEVFMIVADDPNEFPRTGYLNGKYEVVPMTYINREHQCNYTFTKDVYITFGWKSVGGLCEVDENTYWGNSSKKFDWGQWTTAFRNTNAFGGAAQGMGRTYTNTAPVDLGDNIQVLQTRVRYANSVTSPRLYPAFTNMASLGGKSLQVQRTGGTLGLDDVVTSVKFNAPVIPEFAISDIDWGMGANNRNAYDEVEVYGICSTTPEVHINPTLSYAGLERNALYKISTNRATAYRNTAVDGNNVNGRVLVKFSSSVDSLCVVYRIKNANAGTSLRAIYISPITLRSATPPPAVNEDGWSFTKRAENYSVLTCEQVRYTFLIRNTNCGTKPISYFSDQLPAGMKWVEGSIGLDTLSSRLNIDATTGESTFNPVISSDGRTLTIENFNVPGVHNVTLTATAEFEETAQSGQYANRASMRYDRIVNGSPVPQTLPSQDAYRPNPPTDAESYTTITATYAERPKVMTVAETYSKQTYRQDEIIEVTYQITNPNTFAITDMFMNIEFNPEFTYVDGSLTSDVGGLVVTKFGSEPLDPGSLQFSLGVANDDVNGFTIPNGPTTITFKLKAPVQTALALADPDLTPRPVPEQYADLGISWGLSCNMDDPCIAAAIPEGTTKLIPYSSGKLYIISNKNVTGKIHR